MEQQRAYRYGVAEAKNEWAQGRATIYYQATPGVPVDGLDPETGLTRTVVAVDVGNLRAIASQQGHNDTIAELIRKNGLPAYSRKPWAAELSDLRKYFALRTASRAPTPLVVDAPAVTSDDGKFALAWKSTPNGFPGCPWCVTDLVLTDGQGRRVSDVSWGMDPTWIKSVDVYWGAAGSDVAIFRVTFETTASPSVSFNLLDLRTGRWLHSELY